MKLPSFRGKSEAKPREVAVKLNYRGLPFLVALLVILQLTSPYKGWVILLTGLSFAWLIAFFWVRSLSRNLELAREMRFGWAQVGDHLVERFTLTNYSKFPALWAEIVDHSNMPGYGASRGTGVDGDGGIRWHNETVCSRRGLFYLGPTELRSGDPFGIYTFTHSYPSSMPLLVLPPIVPLPSIEVAPGGRTGEGRPRAHAFDRTVSASGARDYVPGDSLRWIHWKLSARHDELLVRTFDGTPAGDWWILLDMNRHVQAGTEEDSTAELGVILAASLADRGVRAGRAVGLMAHGEQLVWLPPREGEGQRWEILRALAMVKQGSRPISELLARVRPTLGQRTSVVIITPAVDSEWVENLVPLMRRGAVPTVLLLDPVSFGGGGNLLPTKEALSYLGVSHYTVTRDLLERPEARPGKRGTWRWRVMGTGKAVPVERPVEAAWRALS